MTATPESPPEVQAFAARLAGLQQNRQRAVAAMHGASGSASSADSAVTVSVDAEGILTALSFGADADPGSPALADTIMRTVRAAQASALERAALGVADAVGDTSRAVTILTDRAAGLRATDRTDIAGDTPAARPDFTEVPDGD
ncbi:MAG: YbaB/EbfC family nucleoid-associated protein [Jatrophihabitans sp.]